MAAQKISSDKTRFSPTVMQERCPRCGMHNAVRLINDRPANVSCRHCGHNYFGTFHGGY
jgi:transcription elongation factor Elf1